MGQLQEIFVYLPCRFARRRCERRPRPHRAPCSRTLSVCPRVLGPRNPHTPTELYKCLQICMIQFDARNKGYIIFNYYNVVSILRAHMLNC
jgi:hypothetical protein